MPIGFNSAARNLFLLGSSGAQAVSNFFKKIDQTAGTDGVYLPDEIKYITADQKYVLAGSNETASSQSKGWIEKRTDAGTSDWKVELQSNMGTNYANLNTTLRALEIDSTGNLFAVGKTGTVPWVVKYTSNGVLTWKASSATAGVGYTGLAIDSSNNVYACGSSSTRAYVERLSGSLGEYTWGRDSRTTAGVITYNKCATNSRGEVIIAGKIGDTLKDKGYISKLSTSTGNLLWERTIEDLRLGTNSSYWQTECTDVFVDSVDNIFVVGTLRDTIGNLSKGFLIKYSPEGNIIWQRETKLDRNFEYVSVKSNGLTGETIVAGRFRFSNDDFVLLNKYSQDGTLIWSRSIFSSLDQTIGNVSIDFDPSFYYLIFTDETVSSVAGEPDTYTFGKLSTSGNGLGDFQYTSLGTTFDYKYLSITDDIGRLSDGSLRQDASDFITYPHSPNKILFDDYATQIANKKVQVFAPNTYSTVAYTIPTTVRVTLENIVSSGLVLSLDAGRTLSVPKTNILTTWVDYNGNQTNYEVLGAYSVKLKNTTAGWVGYFPATVSSTGKYVITFTYYSDSDGSGLVLDNDGIMDNTYNTTFAANITHQTYTGSVDVNTTGNIQHFFRRNSGGNIYVTNVSYFKLETTWTDLSGNGNTGTLVNGVGYSASNGGSLSFDGVDDNIVITNNSSFNVSDNITLEMWIKLETSQSGGLGFLIKYASGYLFYVTPDAGKKFAFDSRNGDGTYYRTAGTTNIQDGVWKYLTAQKTGLYYRVYVNGVLEGTTIANTVGDISGNVDLRIGTDTVTFLNGKIGSFKIYNRALSATEVSQNFNALRGRFGI